MLSVAVVVASLVAQASMQCSRRSVPRDLLCIDSIWGNYAKMVVLAGWQSMHGGKTCMVVADISSAGPAGLYAHGKWMLAQCEQD